MEIGLRFPMASPTTCVDHMSKNLMSLKVTCFEGYLFHDRTKARKEKGLYELIKKKEIVQKSDAILNALTLSRDKFDSTDFR